MYANSEYFFEKFIIARVCATKHCLLFYPHLLFKGLETRVCICLPNACAVCKKQHICRFDIFFWHKNFDIKTPMSYTHALHIHCHFTLIFICFSWKFSHHKCRCMAYCQSYMIAMCDAVAWNSSHRNVYTHLNQKKETWWEFTNEKLSHVLLVQSLSNRSWNHCCCSIRSRNK